MREIKVGDKVKVVSSYGLDGESNGELIKVGDIGYITEVCSQTSMRFSITNDSKEKSNWLGGECLEIIEQTKINNMKKFKNTIVVTGSPSLLRAFEKELTLLGYKSDEDWNKYANPDIIKRAPWAYLLNLGENNKYQYHNHPCRSIDGELLNLPQDWNRALELAAELEEEIPEYIVVTKNSGNNTRHPKFLETAYLGDKIYKVLELSKTEKNDPSYVCEGGFVIYTDYAKVSTKEAYEAQQKELADKELLEKLIKESGFEVGMKFSSLCGVPYKYQDWRLSTEWSTSFLTNSNNCNSTIKLFTTYEGTPCFATTPSNYSKKYYYFDLNYWKKAVKAEECKTLILGDKKVEVKISKGKIEAINKNINIDEIKVIWNTMRGGRSIAGHAITTSSIKIGCTTFTLEEIEKVIETYNKLNK